MEFTEAYPSTSTVRECRRYGSGIHDGSGFRCCRSTANSSRGIARIYFLYVELTLSHHCRAWLFRSSQLANVRPARKLLSINQKGRSTPVSYTHLRAHETDSYLVCRLLLE